MPIATINRFDGGIRDPRETTSNGCTSMRHYMGKKRKLTPYRDMETETVSSGTLANFRITDVIRYNYSGSNTRIFALGQKSDTQAFPKIFVKATANDPSSAFEATANGEHTTGTYIPGTLIGYKGNIYALFHDGTNVKLIRHTYDSSMTDLGVIGALPANGVVPAPFVHPKDNNLYLAASNTAAVFDGTTISTRDFSTGHTITSITWYGNAIGLGMVGKDTQNSVLAIWSGSTTSSELIDVVDFGDDTLLILENVGDVLIGVSGLSVGGASDVGIENAVVIRAYAGGSPTVLHKIESIGTLGSRVYPLKQMRNNVLYFPASIYLNGTRVHQIWCVFKNELGQFVVQPDRKINNNTEVTTDVINGFSIIGDWMWVNFGSSSTGSCLRTNDATNYTATSEYETLVNQGMNTEDLARRKRVKWVRLKSGSPTGASYTMTLYYTVDGSTPVSLGSITSSAEVLVTEFTNQADGKPIIGEGREYTFKIEGTGYGEVYSLEVEYEPLTVPF